LANDPKCATITQSLAIKANMAKRPSLTNKDIIESKPKKSRQGMGKHTKYASTSRNKARKRYRGQGM
jgi:hypothetical protein